MAKRHGPAVWLELSLFTSDRQTAATAGAALDAVFGMLMRYSLASQIDDRTFARVMQGARDLTRAEIRERRAVRAAERAKSGQVGELPPRPARQSIESDRLPGDRLDLSALLALAASAPSEPDQTERTGKLAAVPAELSAQLLAVVGQLPPLPPQPLSVRHAVSAAAMRAASRIRLTEEALANGDHDAVIHLLPAVLRQLSIEADGAALHVLGEAALRGSLEAWHEEHDRLRGAFPTVADLARAALAARDLAGGDQTPAPSPTTGSAPKPPPVPTGSTGGLSPAMLLSVAFTHYCQSKEIEAAWTDDSRRDAETAVRLFCELVGDKPLREITRADALQFRTQLSRISSDWGQSRLYADPKPGNPHNRVNARRAIEISEGRNDMRRLSLKTINKQTSTLNGVWNWARDNAGCKVLEHPFEGLQKKPKGKRRRHAAKLARDAFQVADLHRIFGSQRWHAERPFTGKDDGALRAGARPSLYFGLLLAAYAGMRLAEIVQLRVGDVTLQDGYAVIRIGSLEDAAYARKLKRSRHERIDDPNAIKTEAAARSVPVHPVLVRLGFLRYLELRRGTPMDMLFTDINDAVKDWTKNLARYFRTLRQELALGQKKTFHSFRHTVRTMLDSILGDKARTSLLIGHDEGYHNDEVVEGYNKGWWTRPLYDDISKLTYGIPAFGEDATLLERLQRDGFVLTQEPLPGPR
jgi:integrase